MTRRRLTRWAAAAGGAALTWIAFDASAEARGAETPDNGTPRAKSDSTEKAPEKQAKSEPEAAAAQSSVPATITQSAASSKVMQQARQGVVVLERGGRPLGLGTVLGGDGRILTALSSLGHGNAIDARFADGSLMRVRVGHTDRAWDLALLVPQNGRWQHGLRPSDADATRAGTSVRSFVNAGKDVAPARVIVKGLRTLLGGDSVLLRDGIDLGSRFDPKDIGGPILDDRGRVVGVLARACAPDDQDECARVPYGVPVAAIKAFLRAVPRDAVPPAPWLGIQGKTEEVGKVRGVRVLEVHPNSPAGAAGLRGGSGEAGDIVVAVNGTHVASPRDLADVIDQHAVGDSIELLVFGSGRFRHATVTLRALPDPSSEAPKPGAGSSQHPSR